MPYGDNIGNIISRDIEKRETNLRLEIINLKKEVEELKVLLDKQLNDNRK